MEPGVLYVTGQIEALHLFARIHFFVLLSKRRAGVVISYEEKKGRSEAACNQSSISSQRV